MRALFSNGCSYAPGWVKALTDRRVSKAIRAVHANLAHPWTVAGILGEAEVIEWTIFLDSRPGAK